MKIIDNEQFIFAEKYRPQTIDDVILDVKTKKKFNDFIKSGRLPHVLLSSTNPGLGKCLHKDEELELYVSDEIYEILIS